MSLFETHKSWNKHGRRERRKIGRRGEERRGERKHTHTQKCETDGTRKKSVVIVLITMGWRSSPEVFSFRDIGTACDLRRGPTTGWTKREYRPYHVLRAVQDGTFSHLKKHLCSFRGADRYSITRSSKFMALGWARTQHFCAYLVCVLFLLSLTPCLMSLSWNL